MEKVVNGVLQIKQSEVLSLRIKKIYFDQIKAGTKKIEYRELSQFYVSRIFKTERNDIVGFKDIFYMLLYVGNAADAEKALYRIDNIEIDEDNNVIKIFIGEYIEIVSN